MNRVSSRIYGHDLCERSTLRFTSARALVDVGPRLQQHEISSRRRLGPQPFARGSDIPLGEFRAREAAPRCHRIRRPIEHAPEAPRGLLGLSFRERFVSQRQQGTIELRFRLLRRNHLGRNGTVGSPFGACQNGTLASSQDSEKEDDRGGSENQVRSQLYLMMHQNARTPSLQPIFLPSS